MGGIRRDRHGVHPDGAPLLRQSVFEVDPLARLGGGAPGLGHVAAVAQGETEIPVHQLGHRLGLELADIGLDPLEQGQGRLQIVRLAAAGIPPKIVQHHRQHLVRGVDDRDAAICKFRRQLGLEQHVQAADRGIRHPLLDSVRIVGEPYGAPGVGHHRLLRMGVGLLQPRQAGVYVPQVLQLALVERLQAARPHQPLRHRVPREDEVIPAATRHQLGLQGLAAVHHVVDDPDPGLPGEFAQGIGGEIIGPVVEAQHLLLCRLPRPFCGLGPQTQQQGQYRGYLGQGAHDGRPPRWPCPSRLSKAPYISGRRSR